MAIYFARFGHDGPVKIGYSRSPAMRLDLLSSRLWDDVYLIRLLDGAKQHEYEQHQRFSFCRIRGEWFRFHPAMMGDLGLPDLLHDLEAVLPHMTTTWQRKAPVRATWATALRVWMIAQGHTQHSLAVALGCTRSSVDSWLRLGVSPNARVSRRLNKIADQSVVGALAAYQETFAPSQKARAAA